jgi:DNA-binding CsgD family transcriptional regulator
MPVCCGPGQTVATRRDVRLFFYSASLIGCERVCVSDNPEIAFGGTKRLLSLLELIYSAVSRPDLWPVVLEEIAELIAGESTCLFASFPQTTVLSLARMDPTAWDVYSSYYASINVWMQRGEALVPDGDVLYSHRVIADPELEQTEFYNDYLVKNDMQYSAGLKIPLGSNLPPAFIACQRPKSKGPFQDSEGLVFQTLLPHLQRALTLYLQFSQMQASVLGLESALDAFEHAVFGLDRQGRVVLSNRHAEALARSGACIRLTNGRLTATHPAQNAQFETLLSEAIDASNGIGLSSGGAMLLHNNSVANSIATPLRVTVTPLRVVSPDNGVQLAVLVFLSDPAVRPQSRTATLRSLYGLTPVETRVAELLLEGLDVRAVSEALGMTLETTRFRVKQILAKTGAGRQSELIRLLLSLPGTPALKRPGSAL